MENNQNDKRGRGRPHGWRKESRLEAMLPAMRISTDLEAWLLQEMDEAGLEKLVDIVRSKLNKEMRVSKRAKTCQG